MYTEKVGKRIIPGEKSKQVGSRVGCFGSEGSGEGPAGIGLPRLLSGVRHLLLRGLVSVGRAGKGKRGVLLRGGSGTGELSSKRGLEKAHKRVGAATAAAASQYSWQEGWLAGCRLVAGTGATSKGGPRECSAGRGAAARPSRCGGGVAGNRSVGLIDLAHALTESM